MTTKHVHTTHYYTETSTDIKTNTKTLSSYCLSCGEKVYEVTLKRN